MLSALQTRAGCELSLPIYSLLLYLSFPPCPFLPSSLDGTKPRALYLPGKYSTTELNPHLPIRWLVEGGMTLSVDLECCANSIELPFESLLKLTEPETSIQVWIH